MGADPRIRILTGICLSRIFSLAGSFFSSEQAQVSPALAGVLEKCLPRHTLGDQLAQKSEALRRVTHGEHEVVLRFYV